MIDRKLTGHTFEPYSFPVEIGALRFFARAIGEKNPIYFEEEAAQYEGYRSILALPTFAVVLSSQAPHESIVSFLKIDIRKLLHGEQTFQLDMDKMEMDQPDGGL